MKKERLLEFCKKHKIEIPKGATVEFIHAAIVRASLHNNEVTLEQKECFGFWENEDTNCVTCDFEAKCFKASVGMDKQEYFKKMESLEVPRIRTTAKSMTRIKKLRL